MDSYAQAVEEFRELVNTIFDPNSARLLEPYGTDGNLTFVLGQLNSLALNEKLSASQERQNQIDSELRELNSLALRAFNQLEHLKV